MVPKYYQKFYQKFLTSLTTLRDQITSEETDIERLSHDFQIVQKIFQDQILKLTTESLENSTIFPRQSIQTEIHRTFRLLRTDFLFLQSSHKQRTKKQRLELILNHIEKLISYCQVILTN